ncbi:hypothetical protein HU200_001356 [Digitaria exilis]|uniref:F-box domain-containing protein n=1 Tax=Digitaria exilis TaxID=1010633 RepID=A0A835L072_9POAL|nr:hypothetical protein HU200_001356 [Digitaria exilis]
MDRLQGGEESLPKPSLSPEEAAIVEKVLGNDDLLREVFRRFSLPTLLVRIACVCRRWLRIVSSQGFLDDFRRLHPPRLLGSFPNKPQDLPKLLPRHELPDDLIAVTSHAKAYFSGVSKNIPFGNYVILDIRNGHMLVAIVDVCDRTRIAVIVCTPFKAAPLVYLPFSQLSAYRGTNKGEFDMFEFLPEDGGDGRSYFEVRVIKRYNGDPMFILATGCRIYLLERSGDNAEFVYLSISDTIDNYSDTDYLLHLKTRTVEVVSESHWQITSLLNPFMVIWPPTFPAVMNEEDEDERGHAGL